MENNWIECEKTLDGEWLNVPNDSRPVLVTTSNNEVRVGFWFYSWWVGNNPQTVIAWRELPLPYKKSDVNNVGKTFPKEN